MGFGFVDDYDQIITGAQITSPAREVTDQMQRAVADWAGTIKVTGGVLEPTKYMNFLDMSV